MDGKERILLQSKMNKTKVAKNFPFKWCQIVGSFETANCLPKEKKSMNQLHNSGINFFLTAMNFFLL